ncbi:iron ABC transporter permease [Pseudoclavibacter endophyticus]|uniref:Iron ABC transporter permease n=1 Tax=Pseudoclavibacter endophyticus TaxID=1778590 RepID=A0A6H9WII9_9MICO|nr:iron ABC transporter permease [Pseudoclavibacter endophyticus]KAB1649063.1 iron ABC transporter permease [Pseudoclavibacter endophyticus]GGA65762.1 iron ABC transporter permease [Pseudoclavibacter endophyticus]
MSTLTAGVAPSAHSTGAPTRGSRPSPAQHPNVVAKRVVAIVASFVVGAALLVLVAGLSLAVGAQPISPGTVVSAVFAYDPANAEHAVVGTLRVPRLVAGLVAGAAFGVAGAVMQALTRNDLADPGLLGVNGGASLAVVLTIALLGISNPGALVWFAMLGAAIALGIVLLISVLRSDRASDAVVPIAGMSVTTLCTAGVAIVMVSDRATLATFRHWQVGSLAGRDLDTVWQLSAVLAAGFLLAIVAGPLLDLLSLGDDLARGLGANLGLSRAIALGAIVLLCGAAVSIAGPIAFVGLVVPHVVRGVTGASATLTILGSAIGGPILLLSADVIGRIVVPPGELEAGLVVAIVGAPALVIHAHRITSRRRAGRRASLPSDAASRSGDRGGAIGADHGGAGQ